MVLVTTSDHQDHKTADSRLYHTNTYLSGMSKEPKIIRRASRGPDILRPNDAQTARLGRALSAARRSGVIRARNRAQSRHMSRERSSQRARSPSTRTRGRIERDPAPERRLRAAVAALAKRSASQLSCMRAPGSPGPKWQKRMRIRPSGSPESPFFNESMSSLIRRHYRWTATR